LKEFLSQRVKQTKNDLGPQIRAVYEKTGKKPGIKLDEQERKHTRPGTNASSRHRGSQHEPKVCPQGKTSPKNTQKKKVTILTLPDGLRVAHGTRRCSPDSWARQEGLLKDAEGYVIGQMSLEGPPKKTLFPNYAARPPKKVRQKKGGKEGGDPSGVHSGRKKEAQLRKH